MEQNDPLAEAGHTVKRYRAFVPVAGIAAEQRRQLIATGGNLMSLELIWMLHREPHLSVIHSHALNRLGGIAGRIARSRRIPFVVTIHGGVLDLPAAVQAKLVEPLKGGFEWGKLFGALVRSRHVLADADAILTCNHREARLLKEKYPRKIICVQPHGVPAQEYQRDCRAAASQAFPNLEAQDFALILGRIDPIKNQDWIVEQWPRVLRAHPKISLVLAGACTDEAYGKLIKKQVRNLGLENEVIFTGALPPGDERLIGLLQKARVVLLPSISETFGLIILEAWAAGTPVLSSRTSGAADLIHDGEDGWLFDLTQPDLFHNRLNDVLDQPERARDVREAGRRRVLSEYDCAILARRVKHLYEELLTGP